MPSLSTYAAEGRILPGIRAWVHDLRNEIIYENITAKYRCGGWAGIHRM